MLMIYIDIFFVLLSSFNIYNDMITSSWGWLAFNSLMLLFWVYCLVVDWAKLK